MTIRTPFDFGPAGPDGELKVSPVPEGGTALGDHTYYFARRFHFSDGNYTLTIAADDGASLWIGTTQLTSRIIGSCTLAGGPSSAFVNIPQGDYRLDVLLQNIPASPAYFTLVIKKGEDVVYTSDKTDWLLDDVAISDDDMPLAADYRFGLPMFTTLPNWQQGVTERLSWLTDILDSETGAEQRRSVRRNARRQFEANFLRQRHERDRLDTFFSGIGAAEFMFPLWHEAVRMEDGIDMEGSGVRFPDGELQFREFYKGDLVFVNKGDPADYDILQVGDVDYTNNRFTWAFPPPRAWPIGTRIYPMRAARMITAPRMSNITDTVSTATLQFDLSEPYKVAASWGNVVGGQPFFPFVADRATNIDSEYGRKFFTIDNDSGVPVTLDHGRFTSIITQASFRLFGRIKATQMRQWLQAARGQAAHFFMPTFMQDIEPVGDIQQGAQEVVIRPQGFYEYMLRPQPTRIQLSFQLRTGTNIYANITNVSPIYKTDPDGSVSTPLVTVAEMLSLDVALPEIDMSEVKRVSFVTEARFNQDAFELHHNTNQQAAVDVTLTFRQAFNPRVGTPA